MAFISTPEPVTSTIPFRAYETWYAIYGDLTSTGHVPLVVLHGGPGAGHDYPRSLGDLTRIAGIPVVMYDQIGCGRSTHLRDAPPGTFTIQLFLDELDNLLNILGINEYDMLGQSWGGMLACEHATRQPAGLRRLILAGTPASFPLAEKVRIRCYNEFPPNLRDAMFQHEKDGKDTPEYWDAKAYFRKTNGCRLEPMPAGLVTTYRNMRDDFTVPMQMVGSSDLYHGGVLKDWSIIERLYLIKNEVLAIHGKYDWCGQEAAEPFRDANGKTKMVTLDLSGHFCTSGR